MFGTSKTAQATATDTKSEPPSVAQKVEATLLAANFISDHRVYQGSHSGGLGKMFDGQGVQVRTLVSLIFCSTYGARLTQD
jgi:hypothetical protein